MLLAFLAAATVSDAAASEGRAVCLRRLSFDGQPPQDQREHSLKTCRNHAANTCCYPQHAELVHRRLGAVADSKECSKVSEEVLCVLCDARFGTGELESKGNPVLCPQLCEKWFKACQNAYVTAAPSGSGSALTFCGDESLFCSPLFATHTDSISFCRGMGYEVLTDQTPEETDDLRQRKRRCFNGVPTASYGAAPKRTHRISEDERREWEADKWRYWFVDFGYKVYEVLSRPEVWLLLVLLGYFIYQGAKQAGEIINIQLNQERQCHRQQVLLRYGVQEEELESCSGSSDDEKEDEGPPIREETEKEEQAQEEPPPQPRGKDE